MTERRWLARVPRDEFDPSTADVAQNLDPAIYIHRFVEAIFDRLSDQRMVRNRRIAVMIFQTAGLSGKNGGQEIIAAETLQIRRNTLAIFVPQHGKRPSDAPTPTR